METIQPVFDFLAYILQPLNVLGALALILGGIAAKTGLNFVNEVRDIVVEYNNSIDPASPGGTARTEAEREKLRKEIIESLQSTYAHYQGTIFDFLGRIYRSIAFWK